MKRTTSLAVVFVMTLALSTPVFCGDMPGPGFVQQSVEGNSSSSHPAIGEPVSQQQPATDSSEATSDTIDQAIFFAIQLMNSLI